MKKLLLLIICLYEVFAIANAGDIKFGLEPITFISKDKFCFSYCAYSSFRGEKTVNLGVFFSEDTIWSPSTDFEYFKVPIKPRGLCNFRNRIENIVRDRNRPISNIEGKFHIIYVLDPENSLKEYDELNNIFINKEPISIKLYNGLEKISWSFVDNLLITNRASFSMEQFGDTNQFTFFLPESPQLINIKPYKVQLFTRKELFKDQEITDSDVGNLTRSTNNNEERGPFFSIEVDNKELKDYIFRQGAEWPIIIVWCNAKILDKEEKSVTIAFITSSFFSRFLAMEKIEEFRLKGYFVLDQTTIHTKNVLNRTYSNISPRFDNTAKKTDSTVNFQSLNENDIFELLNPQLTNDSQIIISPSYFRYNSKLVTDALERFKNKSRQIGKQKIIFKRYLHQVQGIISKHSKSRKEIGPLTKDRLNNFTRLLDSISLFVNVELDGIDYEYINDLLFGFAKHLNNYEPKLMKLSKPTEKEVFQEHYYIDIYERCFSQFHRYNLEEHGYGFVPTDWESNNRGPNTSFKITKEIDSDKSFWNQNFLLVVTGEKGYNVGYAPFGFRDDLKKYRKFNDKTSPSIEFFKPYIYSIALISKGEFLSEPELLIVDQKNFPTKLVIDRKYEIDISRIDEFSEDQKKVIYDMIEKELLYKKMALFRAIND